MTLNVVHDQEVLSLWHKGSLIFHFGINFDTSSTVYPCSMSLWLVFDFGPQTLLAFPYLPLPRMLDFGWHPSLLPLFIIAPMSPWPEFDIDWDCPLFRLASGSSSVYAEVEIMSNGNAISVTSTRPYHGLIVLLKKSNVDKLKCKVCSRFTDEIRGRKNYSDKWIIEANSTKLISVCDTPQNNQHARTMSLLKKQHSEAA